MLDAGVTKSMEGVLADLQHNERLIGIVAGPMRAVAHGMINLDTRLGRVEGKVDALDVKVDALDVKVTVLEGKVDVLEVKVDRLEGKVDDLGVKFEGLEGKVDKLDAAVGLMHDDIRLSIAQTERLAGHIGRAERKGSVKDDDDSRADQAMA